jgi:hypothetical protein
MHGILRLSNTCANIKIVLKGIDKSIGKYYIRTMHSERKRRQVKEHVIAMKLDQSLVDAIDRQAQEEGLTRSAVIRRLLIQHFDPRTVLVSAR